jgi:hypothetical protein
MRFRYLKYSVAALLALCTGMEAGQAQPSSVSSALKIPRIKYSGGGDWYNDPSAEVNLLKYVQQNTGLDVDPRYEFVEIGGQQLLSYPIAFLTGHGNITLNEGEVKRLRTYLENGGFLYIDDDYGLDKAIRREMKKVFPGQEMVELPFSHGIYHIHFDFANGPPKTHEHDGKPARGFGLFHNGRLVVYYTYESNPTDGWADPQVHNDPDSKRQEALRFGTNIVVWALTR